MLVALTNTRAEYDKLGERYLIVAAVVFGLVALALVGFSILYRAGRRGAPGRTVEAKKTETIYAIVLALVTAALVTITFRAETRDDSLTAAAAASRAGAVHIDVVGAQWSWRFIYPGRPRVQLINRALQPTEFVVPVGRPVLFRGRSQDVVHDFWVPDLRFQRQVWPDHAETWGLVFPHPGIYQGLCAWFCGLHHQRMDFRVHAVSPDAFRAWLAARRRAAT